VTELNNELFSSEPVRMNVCEIDLLCVRSHQAELSILDAADTDLIIESLCVYVCQLSAFFFFVRCIT